MTIPRMLTPYDTTNYDSLPVYEKPKHYKYRLCLDVYEDEPFIQSNKRYVIDRELLFNDIKVVYSMLERNFKQLLKKYKKETKTK